MKRGGRILLWVLFGLLIITLVTFVTQQLWNWLIPSLFNGPVLTFWQTLGLLVLSKILFGGFGKKHHHDKAPFTWKKRLREKFSAMTPEERETWKDKMREKWCSRTEDEN